MFMHCSIIKKRSLSQGYQRKYDQVLQGLGDKFSFNSSPIIWEL